MNKFLEALKCKDGWLVKIERTESVEHEDDVYKIAVENGMGIKEVIRDPKTGEKIKMKGWL